MGFIKSFHFICAALYIEVIVSLYVAMIEASGIKIGASGATILRLWSYNRGFRAKIRGFGAFGP